MSDKDAITRRTACHGFGPDHLERKRLAAQATTRRKLFHVVVSRKRMWEHAPDRVSPELKRTIERKDARMLRDINVLANAALDLGCTEGRVQRILDGERNSA